MTTITTPTLLVDESKCRANIERMLAKATSSEATLRPHFKTHHSAHIAGWFREMGVSQCTVSSVSMGHYFADHGWEDITIAFPYNLRESESVSELAGKTSLNILLESEESLEHARKNIENSLGYFIKVDVGTYRTGVDPRNRSLIQTLVDASSEKLQFKGFLAHAGHTYGAKGEKNIRWLFEGVKKMLLPLREEFGGIITYGDTPSCSTLQDLSMFDEIRAGNFVFYDWMQKEIGSCQVEDIAVCLAAPVVSRHPEREEIVVMGGGVHLSKDSVGEGNNKTYGKVVKLTEDGWNTEVIGNVSRLSQEHGIIQLYKKWYNEVRVGDLIGIIPVHSCLAADLQGYYLSTHGQRIEKIVKN